MESVSLPSWLLYAWAALSAGAAFFLGRYIRNRKIPLGGVRALAVPGYDLGLFVCFLAGGSLLLGGFWFGGLAGAGVAVLCGRAEGWAAAARRLGTLSVPKALGLGFCVATAVALPLQFLSSLIGLLFQRLHWPVPLEPAVQIFENARHPWALAGVLAAALLLAPAAEEILFRGFLQPVLKSSFREKGERRAAWTAVIVSALAFAAMHGHAMTFLPLCLMGVLLALIHEWSGSLLLCIAVHFWFNLFTALVLLSGPR